MSKSAVYPQPGMEPLETRIDIHGKEKKDRVLDFLRAAPSSRKLLWRHRDAFLRRVATLRTSSASFLRRAPAYVRTVDWRAVRTRCAAWARQPANAALLVWLAFVAGGVVFVFLLMVGALDSAVPDASRRERWAEAANQVLNALFTVVCVYQHPRLFHHLLLLLRWRAADGDELRAVYCRRGNAVDGLLEQQKRKHERVHVGVVLALLHATCFAQYAYCALFWLFRRDARPDWAVNLCMALGLGFPVLAALYMLYSPLGAPASSSSSSTDDVEATIMAAAHHEQQEEEERGGEREWAGGLVSGLRDDPTVAAMSLSCTFCVFGWNMERLGLGNMYVHAFTFALLCAAPVLVFSVAALNVHDATLAFLVVAAGAVLSLLGLLYAGFWRARVRTRLLLLADPTTSSGGRWWRDYAAWLLCAPCALAQEVRTANLYDVENSDEATSSSSSSADAIVIMAPLQREAPLLTAGVQKCVVDAPPPAPVMVHPKS